MKTTKLLEAVGQLSEAGGGFGESGAGGGTCGAEGEDETLTGLAGADGPGTEIGCRSDEGIVVRKDQLPACKNL